MRRYIATWLIATWACLGNAGAPSQPPPQPKSLHLHQHEPLVPVAQAASSMAHPSSAGAGKSVSMGKSLSLSDAMLHVVATHSTAVTPAPATGVATASTTAKPAVALSPVAARAAREFHLDPMALSSGAVKAVSGSHAEVVDPDTVAEQARPGAVFVTRTGAAATRVALSAPLRAALPAGAQTSAVQLGYMVSATAGAQASPVRLAALIADNTGLVLDAAHSSWRGGFSVALSNLDDPADRRVLNTPITVAVTAAGASEVAPAPLSIADLGSWHAVRVTVPDFPGDRYHVSVSADPQDRGNAIDLPVMKPTIEVIAANPQVTGWGIGQTVITLRARGLITPEGYPVTLRNEHGSLDPTYVKLDAQGVATARLRSDSARSTTVGVADAGVVSRPATVVFTAPWLFLAAAVAGGLLGAFIRGKGRRRVWSALAIGVASAILMTLAYAVGIDWVSRALPAAHLASSGEAVVFVLGAVAALLGVGALLPTGEAEKGA